MRHKVARDRRQSRIQLIVYKCTMRICVNYNIDLYNVSIHFHNIVCLNDFVFSNRGIRNTNSQYKNISYQTVLKCARACVIMSIRTGHTAY